MRRTTLLTLLSLGLVFAVGCSVNPVTGKSQLDLMGEAGEIRMGTNFYPGAIQGSLGPIDEKDVQATVERVGQVVATVSHRPGLPYQFTAVNDPEVNAFALPGGKICITRGLIARLGSEDGLAAVLGHEVGHVTARHAVSAYNRQIMATAILVGGAVYMESQDVKNRGLITLGAVIGTQIVLASYSRQQERQSDDLGMEYAVKAGYSPQGMVETQKTLLDVQKRQPGAVERLFASHPMSADRLETAQKRIALLPADVQTRPLRSEPYRAVMAEVIQVRPAWDLASEGQRLLGQDKDREAEGKLAEAVRMVPKAGVIRTLHAVSLASIKQKGAAVDEARQGARLSGDVFVSRLVAGELLLEPDPAAALENLESAEKLLPGQPQVSLLRGQALENLGRKRDAAAAYREAVDRDPNGEVGAEAARRIRNLG
ncbi:MAG TPA: M48 family metalloprotease [Thermoanaerobaculaceae bacterium]|nr:M48 family metalloprotease [Thermoanaerobaculaceae bacterium]